MRIAGPGEVLIPFLVDVPFLVDEKPTVLPVGAAGEGSKCEWTGSLWSRSLELRASLAVGWLWQSVFGSSDQGLTDRRLPLRQSTGAQARAMGANAGGNEKLRMGQA